MRTRKQGQISALIVAFSLVTFFGCDDAASDDAGTVGLDAGLRDGGVRDGGDGGLGDGGRDASAPPDGGIPDADVVAPDAGGQIAAPRSEASVFFVGHSLINFDMPAMLDEIAEALGVTHRYGSQIGNGAPLWWQWTYPETARGEDARVELATGRYDVLVMTELIPIREHVRYSETALYAGLFYDLAVGANPATQVYLYETWFDVNDPAWRTNIDADRAVWEQVVDEVNAARSGPAMLLVPGGAALGRLVDRIEEGAVPGLSSRHDLFVDEIHLSDLGNYFIALVQFATIYRQSPVGAPANTHSRFGDRPFTAPSPEAARIMQEIAWETVSTDPRAGVAMR